MEKIYAVIEDGVVTNIVLWDGKSVWEPEAGIAVPINGPCGIGWGYEAGVFISPELAPEPEPDSE